MSALQAELSRLYLSQESGLIAPNGSVRALVLELARPADWPLLSALWRGVQTDLELPAPAIAVSGIDAYQLWFSLTEPVSVTQAGAFLEGLRVRYLHQVAPGRVALMPSVNAANPGHIQHALRVPALHPATGRWSAFVAPDLAAIFSAEPWLDLPPSPEAQANVLARLECIKPTVFHATLERLSPVVMMEIKASVSPRGNLDPKSFLRGIMNNETIELHLRIEAAKVLLPYFEKCP
jgi:hypothetical protein